MKYIKLLEDFTERMVKTSLNFDIENVIKQICKKLKLRFDSYLGKGARGYAYTCDGDKVVKITSDKKEVYFYLMTKNKNTKYVVKVYDVYKLHSPDIAESYIVIIEKLDKLSDFQIDVIGNNFIKFYYWTELNLSKPEQYVIDELDKWISENYGDRFEEAKKILMDYSNVTREVESLGGEIDECHTDNIGIDKNGIMKCFDNTYSKRVSSIDGLKILTIY